MNLNKKLFFLLCIFFLIPDPESQSEIFNFHDSIQGIIREAHNNSDLWIGYEHIHADKQLKGFYQNRNFEPIWITRSGLSSLGLELFDILAEAGSHGLNREDYHFSGIQQWLKLINKRKNVGEKIEKNELTGLDIVMTDAFLRFGYHLAEGKVKPENIFPQEFIKKNKIDIFNSLNRLSLEKSGVKNVLKCLAPPDANYWQMVKMADRLKTVQEAGGWPVIPADKLLHPGDADSRILSLKRRLKIEGYLPNGLYEKQNFFDGTLSNAVKSFQARHGLETDAIVGPDTLEELNITAGARRKQILVNLERLRWLPQNLSPRHIQVNIAAFTLDAVERGEKKLSMRVIVGKTNQKTPLFSKKIGYIEFNPYWNVPRSIVMKELLPNFKTDPLYMIKNHYELVAGWAPQSPVINSARIAWEFVDEKNFPGRIRQLPGPWNTLGRVKFMFPNQFDVYLHDTPSKYLFQKEDRALSHGCIRVEKPVDLAFFLLRNNSDWTRNRIEAEIKDGMHHTVTVSEQCMVHLFYYTAWADNEQKIYYRRDIYGRDSILWDALQRTPPHGTAPKTFFTLAPEHFSLNLKSRRLSSTNSEPVPHQYE